MGWGHGLCWKWWVLSFPQPQRTMSLLSWRLHASVLPGQSGSGSAPGSSSPALLTRPLPWGLLRIVPMLWAPSHCKYQCSLASPPDR